MATLKRRAKELVNQMLKPTGACIVSVPYLERFTRAVEDLELLSHLPERHAAQLLRTVSRSRSQLRQDLFVLSELDFKRHGYFVEFGATNGITLSNTYLLEKEFGWTGILAEPAKRWHNDLKRNRNAHIETDCVWSDSNAVLTFSEVQVGELSTIQSYSSSDGHHQEREKAKTYNVKTISLEDLLDKYKAPPKIDYLSIDTEGSEYAILKELDFRKYQFRVITCEHNFQAGRDKIYSLLTGNGYVRKYEKFSKFDDWYLRAE